MAKIEGRAVLAASIVITLSEQEAGALDALAGYGIDPFLKVFYEHMGAAYLKPYEAGLRSLFDSVRNGECNVGHVIERAQKARGVFNGTATACPIQREKEQS